MHACSTQSTGMHPENASLRRVILHIWQCRGPYGGRPRTCAAVRASTWMGSAAPGALMLCKPGGLPASASVCCCLCSPARRPQRSSVCTLLESGRCHGDSREANRDMPKLREACSRRWEACTRPRKHAEDQGSLQRGRRGAGGARGDRGLGLSTGSTGSDGCGQRRQAGWQAPITVVRAEPGHRAAGALCMGRWVRSPATRSQDA